MNGLTLVAAGIKGGLALKHKWTDEEREIVRRDYRGTNKSAYQIAARLGVTTCAIKGQVQNLGIAQDKSPRWSAKEIELLQELITQHAPITIARILHRSVNSVVVKSKRLGLSRRVRDGWYTKRDVCEILGVDHHWVQSRIDNGSLKANYHTDQKPQKNGMAMWHILEADLRKFILEHSFELMGRNVDLFTIVNIIRESK